MKHFGELRQAATLPQFHFTIGESLCVPDHARCPAGRDANTLLVGPAGGNDTGRILRREFPSPATGQSLCRAL
jgi:hypothetical protein